SPTTRPPRNASASTRPCAPCWPTPRTNSTTACPKATRRGRRCCAWRRPCSGPTPPSLVRRSPDAHLDRPHPRPPDRGRAHHLGRHLPRRGHAHRRAEEVVTVVVAGIYYTVARTLEEHL